MTLRYKRYPGGTDHLVSNTHPLPVNDYKLMHALWQIEDTYSDKCWVKPKGLRKFGRNGDLDTGVEEMIWLLGGIETLPTGNTINTVVSDDAGDDQTVTIEGHTLSDGELTFVSQSVTLNGTTNVTLATPLARAVRLINTGTTDFAGTVTVFVDGGATHLSSSGGNNQSLKAATSISDTDYWIITSWTCSVRRASQAVVDFKLQHSPVGGVFRTQATATVARDSGTVQIIFDPPLIVPKNHDVRVLATSSANNTQADSAINGYLATTQAV